MRRKAAAIAFGLLLVAGDATAQTATPAAIAVDAVAAVDETIDGAGNRSTGALFGESPRRSLLIAARRW